MSVRPLGFGHSVKYLVKILSFCVKILKFGQNTNICAPKKFAPLTKIPADAHASKIALETFLYFVLIILGLK